MNALPVRCSLTYEKLTSYAFDPNAELLLALELIGQARARGKGPNAALCPGSCDRRSAPCVWVIAAGGASLCLPLRNILRVLCGSSRCLPSCHEAKS